MLHKNPCRLKRLWLVALIMGCGDPPAPMIELPEDYIDTLAAHSRNICYGVALETYHDPEVECDETK